MPAPEFNASPHRYDPYKNFKFRVYFTDQTPAVAGISKVSGLKRSTEVVEHRVGGDPASVRVSPGQTKYEPITLERGLTHDMQFDQWANRVWNHNAGEGAKVSLANFRRNIRIEVLNEAGQVALAYEIYNCWVSEYQPLPELDASANSVAIETITLQNEGWIRLPPSEVPEPVEPAFD